MNQSQDILIVEDEPKLAALLADYLHASSFTTRTIANGLDVVPAVRASPPALVLLDLMLPGRDGIDICRELRRFTDTPIIMVTARVEEIDRLLGLELGADDYICKPFSPREVVARVKAVLRRVTAPDASSLQAEGSYGLFIDPGQYRVVLDGKRIDLTPVEHRLIEVLASQPGRPFSRTALIEALYTEDHEVSDRTIDSHIRNIRRKLLEAAPDRDLLQSVYGVGYRLDDAG